jgi:hypothetical protein
MAASGLADTDQGELQDKPSDSVTVRRTINLAFEMLEIA